LRHARRQDGTTAEIMTDEQFRSIRTHIRIVIALLVLLIVIQLLGTGAAIMLTGG
jgi:hypothetical protein